MGAMASKKASESSPVSVRSVFDSPGEVRGPVATMTLSAGYARGFGGTDGGRDEWMLSLKIL